MHTMEMASREKLAFPAAPDVSEASQGLEQATAPATRRIIHILKHCGYGGGNVHVAVDLACVQAEAGCEVVFVSGGGTFEPLLAQYGVRHVTMVQKQKNPFLMARTAWQFTRLCRSFRPEVVHAHMMGGAAIGYLASRLTGVPLVTTVHNSFDKHSKLMRLGDRVVAVCQAEKQNLVAQGYKADKVDVVMNAPTTSRGWDDADFRALFAKSPVKRIGRDRFVRNVLYAIGNSGAPGFGGRGAAPAGRSGAPGARRGGVGAV